MRRVLVTAAVTAAALAAAGCASADTATEKRKAAEFVSEVRRTDLAPHMTVRAARSLYGDDGGPLCGALRHNRAGLVLPWGRNALTHTPDEQADDLIAYDRVVVRVYCPGESGEFEDLVDDLNAE